MHVVLDGHGVVLGVDDDHVGGGHGLAHAAPRDLLLDLADARLHLGPAFGGLVLFLDVALAHALLAQVDQALDRHVNERIEHEHRHQGEHRALRQRQGLGQRVAQPLRAFAPGTVDKAILQAGAQGRLAHSHDAVQQWIVQAQLVRAFERVLGRTRAKAHA